MKYNYKIITLTFSLIRKTTHKAVIEKKNALSENKILKRSLFSVKEELTYQCVMARVTTMFSVSHRTPVSTQTDTTPQFPKPFLIFFFLFKIISCIFIFIYCHTLSTMKLPENLLTFFLI